LYWTPDDTGTLILLGVTVVLVPMCWVLGRPIWNRLPSWLLASAAEGKCRRLGVPSACLPSIEALADGRRCWAWSVTCGGRLSVTLGELEDALHDQAVVARREALVAQGLPHDAAEELVAEVMVIDMGASSYQVSVAPALPANWDLACAFAVVRAFDWLAGPVVELQGRPRAECPSLFFGMSDR
jgi:hypothetical protein